MNTKPKENKKASPSHLKPIALLLGLVAIVVLGYVIYDGIRASKLALRRSESVDQMSDVFVALLRYAKDHQTDNKLLRFPNDQLSWRVHILPYLGEDSLYSDFNLNEPWDSPHNKPFMNRMPECFACPGDSISNKTCFQIPTGPETLFHDGVIDLRDRIRILILECDEGAAVVWTQPVDWNFDAKDPLKSIGNRHQELFVAGYVHGGLMMCPAITSKTLLLGISGNPSDE